MEETQERLLDTAATLFANHGYAGVSMREIARLVGLTQAAIYHHFANKDALYVAAIAYLFEQHSLGISEQLEAIDDPIQRLEVLVGAMLDIVDKDSRFLHIYTRELLEGDDKKLAAIAESAYSALYEPLYTLMCELAPGTEPQLLIFSLSGMIFHNLEARKIASYLPYATAGHIALPTLTRHITDLFLYGVNRK
jgi:TetR/AcrR family transcriptional regulator